VPVSTDPIVPYWIPKPGGGTRRMAILSEPDAARWHGVAGRVAGVLEARLGAAALGNRARVGREGWRLRAFRPALRRARTTAGRLGARARLLVRTDIAEFYPSVTPSVVARSLETLGCDPSDARLAAELVEGWGSDGYRGLPIGPPGSAMVANAVLHTADQALAPFPFLRWVDDYLIACAGELPARCALERLDEALEALGLSRSERKTRLETRPRAIRWPGGSSLATA
jgi:hypothetical protein